MTAEPVEVELLRELEASIAQVRRLSERMDQVQAAAEKRYRALVEIAHWFGPGNNQARVIACRALECDPMVRHSFDAQDVPASSAVEVSRADLADVVHKLGTFEADLVGPEVAASRRRLMEAAGMRDRCDSLGPAVNGVTVWCRREPHEDLRCEAEVETMAGRVRIEWAKALWP